MTGSGGPELRVDMLGVFRVSVGRETVRDSAWRLRKARALIKLLALTPKHSLHRDQAIESLWPGLEPAAGSNNLRQALFSARRALDSAGDDGGARIELALDVLTLAPDGLAIDVEVFETAAARVKNDPSIESHRAAIEAYGGELLPEDRFEEWAITRREAVKERYLGLLLGLAALYAEAGEDTGAADALQQALLAEPLHERAHRDLRRLYAVTGRRQRGLAQYHLLREALRREFEDEPDDETRRLYQDILARRIGSDTSADPTPAPRRAERARAAAGNLPLQLTSFIGRDRELPEVVGLARRHRLVTLTGPGGCGKTRLALEAASALLRDAADGAWLVELAGLSDGALVPNAVASALGVESSSSRPSQEAVAGHVAEREMLIVLDNCEHLVAACARLVEALLRACPNLRVIATSREPLHAAGEVDWRVPSLSSEEAMRLFNERATNVSSRFVASEDNAAAVGEICRQVDGIPLAIELAAARVSVLAPAQIADRLRDSLALLAASRRTALTRQQTLTATLDWSHELLDSDEQQLFRRLGTFAGDFDLTAVEVVCEGDLDVLARLVDKSLVVAEEHDGAARYLLLDTVRHYTREKLAKASEAASLENRHRRHYLELAEQLGPTAHESAARLRLELEADEMRWALRRALRSEPPEALRLAVALWRFWHNGGERTEGARWLDEALRAAPEETTTRAAALHGRSVLALRTSDHDRAVETANEAVEHFRGTGEAGSLSEELHHLGTITWVFAGYDEAIRCCNEARQIAEQAGLAPIAASVLHTLGVIGASRSEFEPGRALIAQSIDALRELPPDGEPVLLPVAHGYGRMPGRAHRSFLEQTFVTARRVRPGNAIPYALCDLATTVRDCGDLAEARRLFDESLALFDALNDDLGRAQGLCQLGNLLVYGGDHDAGRELLDQSLALREAGNDARGIGLSLLAMTAAGIAAGDLERARATGDRALALFNRTDDGPGRGGAIMLLGFVAEATGNLLEARELQEQALRFWTEFVPNIGWCGPIQLELAHIDAALGERDRIPDRIGAALEAFEHVDDRAGVELCRAAARQLTNVALTAD
jgi:predicted ATPase/DNA-binding SARP family transcriptional activator